MYCGCCANAHYNEGRCATAWVGCTRADMDLNGLVLDGTCGFTDESMARCRRFYPPGTRTTAEKLTYYR